ncbi:cation transporter [Imhoffiella purpurea]|uniref:Cobalt-zinc-cadmium resistance protein CzcD n=1 Tax=Imhoffiella purpurea TaxID=1249627 RepID=W9VA00_9GAMM|nr:cation transporter [Imhoffiella purpurea]EXJ16418.1 Cobalt-zinc-cadmium resistance protein CzcD [Imhoffiella purpurea]
MGAGCCDSVCSAPAMVGSRFRKALWVALIVNAAMFGVEVVGGLHAGSVSLLADAIDFAGDAANYGISLAVLSMGLLWRSRAALVKGLSMAVFGVFILGKIAWGALAGVPPEPVTMGLIAVLALLANAGVAFMLYAYREGDANQRSVWLCSRNDAIGNVAVLLAAAGVFGTGSAWPDLIVALVMAGLALSSGLAVVRHAREELRTASVPQTASPAVPAAVSIPLSALSSGSCPQQSGELGPMEAPHPSARS